MSWAFWAWMSLAGIVVAFIAVIFMMFFWPVLVPAAAAFFVGGLAFSWISAKRAERHERR